VISWFQNFAFKCNPAPLHQGGGAALPRGARVRPPQAGAAVRDARPQVGLSLQGCCITHSPGGGGVLLQGCYSTPGVVTHRVVTPLLGCHSQGCHSTPLPGLSLTRLFVTPLPGLSLTGLSLQSRGCLSTVWVVTPPLARGVSLVTWTRVAGLSLPLPGGCQFAYVEDHTG
jgi:hypothetical protein